MKEARKNKKNPFRYFIYDFAKVTAAPPALLGLRPKILYEDGEAKKRIRGGALVIANHIGMTDPIVLMTTIWYRRHRFICLNTFFERPVTGWFFKRFHCIPVDRDNFGMETLRQIVGHLKDGKLVTMFPEGHMVVGDHTQLDSFKSGMVLMAAMSRCPIVPVYIRPRKKWWNRQVVVIGRPFDVTAAYGPMPSLPDMEKIASILHRQEEHLAAIAEERRKTT